MTRPFPTLVAGASLLLALAPSAQAPRLLFDLKGGTASANPTNLRDGYGRLFFAADDGIDRPGQITPWVTDSSGSPPVALASLVVSATTTAITHGGTWIFEGRSPTTGFEPWRSDGTPAGTSILGDLAPGRPGSLMQSPTLTGEHVFLANDIAPNLWRSDGTTATGIASAPQNVRRLADFAGLLLFLEPPGSVYSSGPTGLWRSDGTAGGTTLVATIRYASRITIGGGIAFVGVYDPYGSTVASLWRTDGSTSGTVQIATFPASSFLGRRHLTGTKGGAFFVAHDQQTVGSELWFSDGTESGTSLVLDIEPGTVSSAPDDLTPFGDGVLFTAQTSAFGRELWFSDGTPAGTRLITDLAPGSTGSSPSDVVAIGARHAVFAADDGVSGRELWITDSTEAGTRLLADVGPGPRGSNPSEPTLCTGQVVFAADDGAVGRELWAVDPGATAQTVGLGCGPRGVRRPELSSDDPVLGTRARLETGGAEPGSAAALLLGPPRPGRQWTGDCFLFLDPAGTVPLASALLTTPRWDIAIPVPLVPAREGLRVGLQVALAPTGGGIELTNGVFWTLSPR
ncbi:MAG: hypothetical protein AAF628_06740 [Planctomycetota bacterium]